MRGGTLLHKVHLAPSSRYSEDIDLVVVGDRPEGHIRKALNRVLSGVLGTPKQSAWADLKLAIRNSVKPSRVLRLRDHGLPLSHQPTNHRAAQVHCQTFPPARACRTINRKAA